MSRVEIVFYELMGRDLARRVSGQELEKGSGGRVTVLLKNVPEMGDNRLREVVENRLNKRPNASSSWTRRIMADLSVSLK